jgi:hypothetical protein
MGVAAAIAPAAAHAETLSLDFTRVVMTDTVQDHIDSSAVEPR